MKYFLAIDIGASSGRHIIGYKNDNQEIILDEVYRFKNQVVEVDNHLIWDINNLVIEVKKGIKICLDKYPMITSMSIDTWGVDYVLMKDETEILPAYSYRDNRTKKIIDEVHKIVSLDELYEITGCQFQEFNTIYQLYVDKINKRLERANSFLMMPEYLMYKLTGKKIREFTNTGTTGMYDIHTFTLSKKIIGLLEFPSWIENEVYKVGTVVGDFTSDVQKEVGGNISVVLCATHDTASAVVGIPMKENYPYISSGTWSLLGIKTSKPILTNESLKANYSNEYGLNYIRFQKNITGLWIIQSLAKEYHLDYLEMVELAKSSNYKVIINVNDSCFYASYNMEKVIIDYLKLNNLNLPLNKNDIICCVFHSLAYSYFVAIKELENITKTIYTKIYIVGGGAKNNYLNELTKFYCQKEVIALPIEATSLGNIKTQMER